MSLQALSRDAAASAAKRIIDELFWVYPDDYCEYLRSHLVTIIEASTEAALLLYQEELLTPSRS